VSAALDPSYKFTLSELQRIRSRAVFFFSARAPVGFMIVLSPQFFDPVSLPPARHFFPSPASLAFGRKSAVTSSAIAEVSFHSVGPRAEIGGAPLQGVFLC